MPHRPAACFRVITPMIAPVVARAHQYITLWKRDEHNVTITDEGRVCVLHCVTIPRGEISGALLHLCAGGVIAGLTLSDERALHLSV